MPSLGPCVRASPPSAETIRAWRLYRLIPVFSTRIRFTPRADIWLFDAVSGAGRKAVFGPGIQHLPVWSPDSRRLVHVIADHSWPKLGLSSLEGTPDKEPLPDTGFMVPTDWSPDGRFILYNN